MRELTVLLAIILLSGLAYARTPKIYVRNRNLPPSKTFLARFQRNSERGGPIWSHEKALKQLRECE